jgi:hypothetical protein
MNEAKKARLAKNREAAQKRREEGKQNKKQNEKEKSSARGKSRDIKMQTGDD